MLGSTGGVFEMGRQETIIDERGPNRVDPLIIPKWGPHMSAGRVARELGLRGPNSSVNSACASATDALGHAFEMIRAGSADILIGGGTEAIITPVAVATMGLMGALSKGYNDTPEKASRPFDLNRDGFVLGEGAGLLVMESLEHAESRGATILAEYIGQGWSFDAADDAAPDAEGQSLSMKRALKSARMAPDEVSWLNAHGTGTPLNDKTETAAIKLAFGDAAYQRADQQHQVDDGALGGGGGRAGGGGVGAGDPRQQDPADDQPRHPGPGVRPGLRAEGGAGREGGRRAEQLVRHGRAERNADPAALGGVASRRRRQLDDRSRPAYADLEQMR